MTDDDLKMHAANIILNHMQDIEFLSIGEHLDEEGVEFTHEDKLKIYDLIYNKAEVRVHFE